MKVHSNIRIVDNCGPTGTVYEITYKCKVAVVLTDLHDNPKVVEDLLIAEHNIVRDYLLSLLVPGKEGV